MTVPRRALGLGVVSLAASRRVTAQQAPAAGNWPDRPMRIVSPFAPGGGTDIVARLLAPRLSERLGQPVIVENRAGANGVIATRHVAAAPPDGSAMLIDAPGIAMNYSLLREPLYDPLRDFEPIAQILSVPFVVVVPPNLPVRTLQDLIAAARARPGALNVAAGGPSTTLAAHLFRLQTGIELTFVPYRGSAPAAAATMAGEVQVMFADFPSVAGQVAGGALRPLAVSTETRTPLLPDVPTAREAGVADYIVDIWYGLYAPSGTPIPIVERLHAEVGRIVQIPDVKERFATLGATPVMTTREAFRAHLAREVARWRDVVTRGGIERT